MLISIISFIIDFFFLFHIAPPLLLFLLKSGIIN
nr:MAG TPA: hypothetical protein [Caudoviricetes sp.]